MIIKMRLELRRSGAAGKHADRRLRRQRTKQAAKRQWTKDSQ